MPPFCASRGPGLICSWICRALALWSCQVRRHPLRPEKKISAAVHNDAKSAVHLTPREVDKLLIFSAGELAKRISRQRARRAICRSESTCRLDSLDGRASLSQRGEGSGSDAAIGGCGSSE